MKYAVEMGSGAVIYVPSFIKIGSGIQRLTGGKTQRAIGCHKPKLKLNCVALVRERTIPTERQPLVAEFSVNFCG
jgi:hypothetical protein